MIRTSSPELFNILEYPQLFVRKESDCAINSTNHSQGVKIVPHPLLHFYWLSETADTADIFTSQYIYISPPILGDSSEICRAAGAAIRYLVVTRPRGYFVTRSPELWASLSPITRFRIGVEIVRATVRLHKEVGIVHGCIGPKYVSVESLAGKFMVRFSRLSFASWVDEPLCRIPPPFDETTLLSPLQLLGQERVKLNQRSDMYQALVVMNAIINPGDWAKLSSTETTEQLNQHKLSKDVLTLNESLIAHLETDDRLNAIAWIKAASALATSQSGTDDEILDYIERTFVILLKRVRFAPRPSGTRKTVVLTRRDSPAMMRPEAKRVRKL